MDERRTRDAEHHPLERATDRSRFAKVNTKLGEYRVIAYLVVGGLLALGFKYSTPSQRISVMEKKVEPLETAVKVLVKLQCFNRSFTDDERELAGLDCSAIRTTRRPLASDTMVRSR